eukprot:6010704-Amphidinium_carterae.3
MFCEAVKVQPAVMLHVSEDLRKDADFLLAAAGRLVGRSRAGLASSSLLVCRKMELPPNSYSLRH